MIKRLFERLLRPALLVPGAIVLVSLAELAVADRKYGLFSGGFGQSSAVNGAAELALFACGYLAAQLAAALLVWKLCARLNRKSGGWPAMFHFALAYGGISLAALNAQYQLHSYFSDAVDFALVKQLGGGSIQDALLFGKNEIAMAAAALGLFALAWWASWRLVRRIMGAPEQAASDRPRPRWIAAAWLAFLALLALIPRTGSDAALGLNRMLVWRGTGDLAALATDFDGDGYGLFGLRTDDHPFDAARHPLALDVPGNGIDEDGYGGDLRLVPVPQPRAAAAVRPGGANVVLVVLESTRADVLGKRIDGKPVAPNLEKLAAAGAGIAPSYSHVAFTTASLKSIFSGRLAPRAGDPSLFTELKRGGYGVAVFSGQPEDFGDISATVAMRDSADIFVDAEKLKDRRAFSFAAQGSLLVDEGILLEEFDRRLGSPVAWRRPQFVYFNFQSPHFPYDHPGVPHRFAHPPIARADISAANRAQVERTYWNAVARSDDALGRLVARLQRLGVWENTLLVVTGDHGESLFEDGFLGHGHIVNDRQFATFLAVNRPLPAVRAPIAISDYRGLVLDLLSGAPPRVPGIAPFLHIGELDAPTTIGLADTRFGMVSLRLDTGLACFERPAGCLRYGNLTGERRRTIDALVARWGSERWERQKR